jgi:hypothetical protein
LFIIEDINGNGSVDWWDYEILEKAEGSNPDSGNWNPLCDLNLDKTVDSADLTLLIGQYERNST